MKQKSTIVSALLAVLFILNSGAAVSAQDFALSPALEIISEGIGFSKCTVITKDIKFTRSDFENAFGKPLESVTVVSLPSKDTGTLKYAGTSVYEGQTIPGANLGLLKFTPSRNAGSTSFSVFAEDHEDFPVSCSITVLEKQNGIPDAQSLEASALSGIAISGSFDIYDPDGDEMTVMISEYPENGVVKLSGNGYVYTSVPGFDGEDSFSYRVCDKYGNLSEAASVTLSVTKPQTDVRYDDMTGHWGYTGALKMTELGLMQGENGEDGHLFNPDAPVTRGDFLAMAMICAGLEDKVKLGAATTFADDVNIPFNIRSYASYAEAGGIISGYRNEQGKQVFASTDEITRAEAASVLSNILGKSTEVSEFDYADAASIPDWARESFATLTAMGIINGSPDGKLEPTRTLTRAEAAQILWNMREAEKA